MRQNHIQGICAVEKPDFPLLRDLGVRYVRLGLGFPFADEGMKTPSERFERSLTVIEQYASEGFMALGTTFGPGSSRYDPQTKTTRWMTAIPAWAGTHNDQKYYDVLEKACEVLGTKTRGMVDLWQIANEPDIDIFRGELTDEQIDRFLVISARAIKRVSPESRTGINIGFITDDARRMIKSIYGMADSPFDYLGIDGYFGSWQPGGPENWVGYIDESHQLSGKPVIINEWGYSSLQCGPITDDPERTKRYNQGVCKAKAWNRHWGAGHTPEVQADFMRQCHRIFVEHPHCIGNFIFRWNDTETCWQCGQPECPAETAWGIVDTRNQPKPAYYALKEEIARL
jgi:hypothetical protein